MSKRFHNGSGHKVNPSVVIKFITLPRTNVPFIISMCTILERIQARQDLISNSMNAWLRLKINLKVDDMRKK